MRDETLASHHDSWFLPYLDVEALSEDPTLFLSLLHHRTFNEPEKWQAFDNANIVLIRASSLLEDYLFHRDLGPSYRPENYDEPSHKVRHGLLYWSMDSGYDEDRPSTMDIPFNFAFIDYVCRKMQKKPQESVKQCSRKVCFREAWISNEMIR